MKNSRLFLYSLYSLLSVLCRDPRIGTLTDEHTFKPKIIDEVSLITLINPKNSFKLKYIYKV